MTKEECLNICKKRFKGKVRKVVEEQINNFYKIEESNFKLNPHTYKVGDMVNLTPDHYLHGTGRSDDSHLFLAENGVISKDATGVNTRHGVVYTAGFWRVKEEISLKEYIENYSGIDVVYNDVNKLVPYNKIDKFVEEMRDVDHWLWEAISSMEIRFMPSLSRDINQYGFILNVGSNEAKSLIKNDVNATGYPENIKKYFVGKNLNEKISIRNSFLNRASYIIFGLNKCFVEGLVVGRRVEKDKLSLSEIKKRLPNCYIANLDGKVIMV